MNKRIKIKYGIIQKKCGDNCLYYREIVKRKMITNNCCIGCRYRIVSDSVVTQNCKEKGIIQIKL